MNGLIFMINVGVYIYIAYVDPNGIIWGFPWYVVFDEDGGDQLELIELPLVSSEDVR